MKNKTLLSDLQNWMRWVVTSPKGVETALKGRVRGPEPMRLLHMIGETPQVSRVERLSIYGDGYFLRLIDCLGANYNSVKNVIGDANFASLARSYLVRYPSTYKCIDNVGHLLPQFLARHPLQKKVPFIVDLARLEWAYHESFYADDTARFDPEKLQDRQSHEWLNARIKLDPSVHLLESAWPIRDLWREDGKWKKEKLKQIKPRSTPILIFRRFDKVVRVLTVSSPQFFLLQSLFNSDPVSTAIEKAMKFTRSVRPTDITAWFQQWAEDGVIQDVRFS